MVVQNLLENKWIDFIKNLVFNIVEEFVHGSCCLYLAVHILYWLLFYIIIKKKQIIVKSNVRQLWKWAFDWYYFVTFVQQVLYIVINSLFDIII